MKYITFSFLFLLCSCTFTISMVHTTGVAEDVIDEASAPNVAPVIKVSKAGG